MKKRILSAFLILFLCAEITPLVAADDLSKQVAQEYRKIIDSTSFYQYANDDAVAFYDLDGDAIPEMFLWASSGANLSVTELQIWAYRNGKANCITSIPWGTASGGNYVYLNAANILVNYSVTWSDLKSWLHVTTYAFDSNRNLIVLEDIRFEEEFEASIVNGVLTRERVKLTCTVNNQAISEAEALRRYDALKGDAHIIIIGSINEATRNNLGMSKRDAISYLSSLNIKTISVTVKNKPIQWTDSVPFIDSNSRTMVPLRAVADAMSLTVEWDGDKREASFTNGAKTIIFPIGNASARTGQGEVIPMDTAAVIVDGRTYAPIRYLAEFFDYAVSWDGSNRTVRIS